MEKISNILPSSPRIKSVDTEDAHPARPGAPALGRTVGATPSQKERLSISPEAKDLAFKDSLARRNPRANDATKIVDEITANFFNKRVKPVDNSIAAETLSDQVAETSSDYSNYTIDKYA